MTTLRNSRDDVVVAAGRLFARHGYHGTSMRELGRELGLFGSSLYSHVSSKQDLLVEVVRRGASFFRESAGRALAVDGSASVRLRALVAGHVDVLLDHLDEARTFLNEARMLDADHRASVTAFRDEYEGAFRRVLAEGKSDGSFSPSLDPKLAAIFILSVLNAVERWYRPEGPLDRPDLVGAIVEFASNGIVGS